MDVTKSIVRRQSKVYLPSLSNSLPPTYTHFSPKLPFGWERGYDPTTRRYFYFNSDTGASAWNMQEVLTICQEVIGVCAQSHFQELYLGGSHWGCLCCGGKSCCKLARELFGSCLLT